MEQIYYVDRNTGDIYNQDSNIVGNLGNGYVINEENHLLLNGMDLGVVDDIRNMDVDRAKDNVKVRKLVKPDNNGLINFKFFLLVIIFMITLVYCVFIFSKLID